MFRASEAYPFCWNWGSMSIPTPARRWNGSKSNRSMIPRVVFVFIQLIIRRSCFFSYIVLSLCDIYSVITYLEYGSVAQLTLQSSGLFSHLYSSSRSSGSRARSFILSPCSSIVKFSFIVIISEPKVLKCF